MEVRQDVQASELSRPRENSSLSGGPEHTRARPRVSSNSVPLASTSPTNNNEQQIENTNTTSVMPSNPQPTQSQAQAQSQSQSQQPFVASTAPLTFTDFLEKMRAPAAMDLVRRIKSFISEMLKSSSKASKNAEADSKRVQDFLAGSEDAFRSHPLWIDSSHEEFEAAGEGLEKYLMTKLYNRCFGVAEEDKERDELLNQRMKALCNFIKPEHLDIPDKYRNESSWTLAQKELQKINTYKAPRDKLVCILNCCRVISNLLSITAEGAGADDFLPILIYVLIMAAPPQLESNLAFIMRYRLASRLNGEAAYFYTNMVSATTFIETISPNSLSIDADEFIAHMQAAGVPGSEDAALPSHAASQPEASPLPSPPPITYSGAEGNAAERKEEGLAKAAVSATPTSTQQEREGRQPSNPSNEAHHSSTSIVNLPTLAQVEEKGSGTLLEAEALGELHMRYKYLYASLSDLKLKDVSILLNDYKELALRYESLSRGYNLVGGEASVSSSSGSGAGQTAVPKLVRAFHRVKPMGEEGQGLGNGNSHVVDGSSWSSSENLIRLADSPTVSNSNGMGALQGRDGSLPEPPSSTILMDNSLPNPPRAVQTANSPLPDLMS